MDEKLAWEMQDAHEIDRLRARVEELSTVLRAIVNSALARGIDSGRVDATHVLEGLSLLKKLDKEREG